MAGRGKPAGRRRPTPEQIEALRAAMAEQQKPTPPSPMMIWLRRHALVCLAGCALLVLANAVVGQTWWAFWPVTVWIIVLLIHLMVARALNPDDKWVNRRIDKLRAHSYDFDHMDMIKSSHRQGRDPGQELREQRGEKDGHGDQ